MKKTITTFIAAVIFCCSFAFVNAQDFEGEIIYKIEYGQLPDQPGIENFLPKELKNSIKGGKTRMDQSFGESGNSQFVVIDDENQRGFVASHMMGQKMIINISEEDMKASTESYQNAEVEYLDEYKDILGYKCQKAVLSQEGVTTTLYVTEKLPNKASRQFMRLKGMPLEITTSQEALEIIMTATSIDKKSIDASIFVKPEGYQELSLQDIKNMGMGDIKF